MKKNLLIIALLTIIHSAYSQAWIQRTNFGGTGRHRASGFSIGNRGYMGIGHVNGNNLNISYKDWWEYDPATDSWSQKADYPVPNYGAVGFSTSTRGYLGGGAALNEEFYEYNPQTNAWTAIPDCPVAPTDQPAFTVNDKGYVIFGNALYEYDPASTSWTAKANAPITFATWCVAFNEGASGYVKSGNTLYEYKPLYDQWIPRAAFPGVNTNGAVAFVRGGRAYIVSGFVGALANLTPQVWEYNMGNNTWAQLNDFPGSNRRFAVAFTINDRGYMGTGTNGINFNDFWEMNDGVSVNELTAEKIQVRAFPNPATEFVQFNLETANASGKGEVRLYTLNGEITDAIPFTGTSCEIARNGKADGVYLYQVLLDGKTISTGKIIFRS